VPPPAARHRRNPRHPAAPSLGAQEDAQAFRELDADGRALFTLPAAERARLREISHTDQPWFTGAPPRPAAPAEAPRSLGGPPLRRGPLGLTASRGRAAGFRALRHRSIFRYRRVGAQVAPPRPARRRANRMRSHAVLLCPVRGSRASCARFEIASMNEGEEGASRHAAVRRAGCGAVAGGACRGAPAALVPGGARAAGGLRARSAPSSEPIARPPANATWDETRPVSTGGGTICVQLVREEGRDVSS
jgi:hypothetical protein